MGRGGERKDLTLVLGFVKFEILVGHVGREICKSSLEIVEWKVGNGSVSACVIVTATEGVRPAKELKRGPGQRGRATDRDSEGALGVRGVREVQRSLRSFL